MNNDPESIIAVLMAIQGVTTYGIYLLFKRLNAVTDRALDMADIALNMKKNEKT